jgi:hypothetical protein
VDLRRVQPPPDLFTRFEVYVRPLGVFVLNRRDRHHLAVITLAAQPAEKSAFEQLGVEPIGLGAPVLAGYGYGATLRPMSCTHRARPESICTALR